MVVFIGLPSRAVVVSMNHGHSVLTSIALSVAVFVCVRRDVRFISAFALVPMVVFIGFPSRTVVVNVDRLELCELIRSNIACAIINSTCAVRICACGHLVSANVICKIGCNSNAYILVIVIIAERSACNFR